MTLNNHKLSGKSLLFIDDDVNLLELGVSAFSQMGCQVHTATEGLTGLSQFYAHSPDLVILDLMMPMMDGWETCTRLRQLSSVPIILISTSGGSNDIIRGLDEVGADDYLVKPFEIGVLIAKVRALLRRVALPPPTPAPIYDDGYLLIDLKERQVRVRKEPVRLTPKEYDLLTYLYLHADQLRPHAQILQDIWGNQVPYSVDVIHKNIRRLRRKLEVDPHHPRYVLTQHGLGYRFKKLHPT